MRYPVAVAVIAAPLISLFSGCADIGHPGMARGHELYDTCIPCHGKHGAGNAELGAPAIAGGDTAAGSQRYSTMCVVCHGPDAKGMEAMVAPPLLDQPDWYLIRQLDKYKSHMRGFDSTDMQGQQMAAMSTSLEDHKAMLDVIAYIKTLKK